MKKFLVLSGWLLAIFLLGINSIRFLNFAFNFAGLEHDSGWYFGVARNLASRGKYASYTNDSPSKPKETITYDLWGRLAVVDKEGFEYFPSGVTVGPAFIFPVALVLKVFGAGLRQFRLFPIFTYFSLLGLMAWLVFKKAGLLGVIFLLVFFNLFPHLFIPLAFEAYGEPTALLYLLIGIMILSQSLVEKRNQTLKIIFGGFFLGLACLVKTLSGLGLVSTLVVYYWLVKKQPQLLKKVFFLAFSFVFPLFLFEIYRFLTLVKIGGVAAYLANTSGHFMVFVSSGSGINQVDGLKTILGSWAEKLGVFEELGLKRKTFYLMLVLFLAGFRNYFKSKKKDPIIFFLLAFWLVNTAWFCLFSFGLSRHLWFGLLLTLFFLAIFADLFLRDFFVEKGNPLKLIIFILLLFLIFKNNPLGLVFDPRLKEEQIDLWRKKYFKTKVSPLPMPLFPQAEQKSLVNFINSRIPPGAKIYYVEGFLVAEISPLVDRVFYSIYTLEKASENQANYVIFGPYQVASGWRIIPEEKYQNQLSRYCGKMVFSNDYYKICLPK